MTKTEVLALATVGANRLREARRGDDTRQFRLGREELSIEGRPGRASSTATNCVSPMKTVATAFPIMFTSARFRTAWCREPPL
jgi:hypothetical protein